MSVTAQPVSHRFTPADDRMKPAGHHTSCICRLWLSVRTKRTGTCVGLLSAGNVTSTRDAAPARRRTGLRHQGPAPTWGLPPSRRSEQAASSPGAPAYTPSEKPPRARRTPPGRALHAYPRAGQARSPARQRPPLAAPHRKHGGTSANTTSGASPGPSSRAAPRIEDTCQVADIERQDESPSCTHRRISSLRIGRLPYQWP